MAVNQNCSAADTCEQNLHGYGPHPDLKTVAPIKYYVKEFGQVGTDNTTALAREDNSRRALPALELPEAQGVLHLGGVTLLNDYLLIARSESGEVKECYMRIDEDGDGDMVLKDSDVAPTEAPTP